MRVQPSTERVKRFQRDMICYLDNLQRSYGHAENHPMVRFTESFAAMVGALASAVEALLWIDYRAAGMPYGDTEEGMRRWADEWEMERT